MKYGAFIITVVLAIIFLTYNPAIQTLTGEVYYVGKNEISINCTKEKKPKFKPSDDIGYSCTIFIDKQTVIEPNEQLQQGQIIAVELKHKTILTEKSNEPLLAASIKILQ